MRRALLLAAVAATLGLPALAQAGGGASLSVAVKSVASPRLVLVARLNGSSPGEQVAFFVASREFGPVRQVPIGVAEVGPNGAARILYTPTWSGEQQFRATLARPDTHRPAVTANYRVAQSTPGPLSTNANPHRPLASVGHVFLDAILTAVALVWLSLFVTLALAFGRLPQLAGEGTEPGGCSCR